MADVGDSLDKVTPEERLKRFLYTSSENARYMSGNIELHNAYTSEKLTAVQELLQSHELGLLLRVTESVSKDAIPRREAIFFVLALAAELAPINFKHEVYITLSRIIRNFQDLCTFVKFYTKRQKRFGSGVRKVINSYYTERDPLELAKEVSRNKGYHCWTHKDLIKLSRPRCNSYLTTVVFNYILFGLVPEIEVNSTAIEIIDILTKAHELKQGGNEMRMVNLVTELGCTSLSEVSPYCLLSQNVWEVLLLRLPVQDVIMSLTKLHKLDFLQPNTSFEDQVIQRLTDAKAIQVSKIHPVEIFIGLKTFVEGGKPIDPKFLLYAYNQQQEIPTRENPECPNVVSALNKAMQLSLENLEPTNKRYLICIDMTVHMQVDDCFCCRNVPCLDAALLLTFSLLKVEKEVTVAVFNGNGISIAELDDCTTFECVVRKLKLIEYGHILLSSGFEWALKEKKLIDVFINLISSPQNIVEQNELTRNKNPLPAMRKYKKEINPQVKLITVCLNGPHPIIADGTRNVLDICGFTKEVPKVIEIFSRDLFS